MASLVVIIVSLAAFSGVWAVTSRPMPGGDDKLLAAIRM